MPSSQVVLLFVFSVPVTLKADPILKVAFLAFMVPEAVPPCWNSSFPPLELSVPLTSSVDPDEISALLSKIRSAPWVLSVSLPERANAFSIVRSLVAEASSKS